MIASQGYDFVSDKRRNLLNEFWSEYDMPLDTRGWLAAFGLFGSNVDMPILLVDMDLPAAPIVYVNSAFASATVRTQGRLVGRTAVAMNLKFDRCCCVKGFLE